jgi:hypothetical protein
MFHPGIHADRFRQEIPVKMSRQDQIERACFEDR